jgi:hypothetical protein
LENGNFIESSMRFVGFLAIVGKAKFAENSDFQGVSCENSEIFPFLARKYCVAAMIYAEILP